MNPNAESFFSAGLSGWSHFMNDEQKEDMTGLRGRLRQRLGMQCGLMLESSVVSLSRHTKYNRR